MNTTNIKEHHSHFSGIFSQMDTLTETLYLKLAATLESKTTTGKYNLKICSHVPGNSQNKRAIRSFTAVSSLTDQVSTNTVGSADTCHSVEWQGSKTTMAAIPQPSWCEDCAVVSWKSEERQLESPSCWRFTDCLHFIVCWSLVSPLCFTCVQLLFIFPYPQCWCFQGDQQVLWHGCG